MDAAHIDLVLEEAGLGMDDIDMIALTSGQCYELVSDNSETLSVIPEPHPDCRAPSSPQKLFELENVHLRFTEGALTAIAGEALARKTGARGLRAIMENIMLEIMYDIPSQPDIKEVLISEDVVLRNAQPIVMYQKATAESA